MFIWKSWDLSVNPHFSVANKKCKRKKLKLYFYVEFKYKIASDQFEMFVISFIDLISMLDITSKRDFICETLKPTILLDLGRHLCQSNSMMKKMLRRIWAWFTSNFMENEKQNQFSFQKFFFVLWSKNLRHRKIVHTRRTIKEPGNGTKA